MDRLNCVTLLENDRGAGASPGFSEGGGGGGRDLSNKLTSQTSTRLSKNHAHAPIRGQCLGPRPTSVCFVESSIFTTLV